MEDQSVRRWRFTHSLSPSASPVSRELQDYSYYCGFECFHCKKKRAFSLRKKAVKIPALREEEQPRNIKSLEKDEDHQPRKRATLQTIIEVLKDELDMAWEKKMKQAVVDPEEQEDHGGLNQVISSEDDPEKEPLRLGRGDHILDDDKQALTKGWIEKRKRSAMCISSSVGEDYKRANKRLKQKKAEASPALRVELRHRDDPSPALPEDFLARVRAMEGSHPILVLQKQLFRTDVAKVENRLSVPVNQIRGQFLTEEEERRVVEGMEVTIIEPSLEASHIMLKKWKMKTTCYLYVFTTQWNSLATRNSLKAGDLVQVWSFRVCSELRFALVKVKNQ